MCILFISVGQGQLWSIATTTLQMGIRVQLNTTLFAKTLLRKDVASSSTALPKPDHNGAVGGATTDPPSPISAEASAAIQANEAGPTAAVVEVVDNQSKDANAKLEKNEDEERDFSSKSQIMTLMTTDVDRIAEFS
jgi:hypothetical protein